MTTYYEIGQRVQAALDGGYGLIVDMDHGELRLSGDDLRQEWDDLAPGESFTIVGRFWLA